MLMRKYEERRILVLPLGKDWRMRMLESVRERRPFFCPSVLQSNERRNWGPLRTEKNILFYQIRQNRRAFCGVARSPFRGTA